MPEAKLQPRFIESRLAEALEDSPVVLVQGPRQCGKTTLAQMVCAPEFLPSGVGAAPAAVGGYDYISFDNNVVRAGAEADPMGFIADLPSRVVLDEVQRVPGLFTALKLQVDRQRVPGQFVLTGSTNILAVPPIEESLAGRLETVRLHPMAQCELHTGAPANPSFIDRLFEAEFPAQRTVRLGPELAERIVSGGYPPALARPAGPRRARWYRRYLESQVQRDIGSISRIGALETLPRILAMAATQTGGLFNLSRMAAPFQISRPTVGDYVTLLERVYLLERLPAWHNNRSKRLVKAPKLHIGDSGLAAALLGATASTLRTNRTMLGQLLETFVYQELRRQAAWFEGQVDFFHYRDKDQVEVDIVLEYGGRVAGVEVKAGATVTASDFRGLHRLREACGDNFAAGAVLYDGEATVSFGPGLRAIPMSLLWESQ